MKMKGIIIAVVSYVIIVVVSFVLLLFIIESEEKTKLQQFTTSDNIDVLVETIQGAYGSYVKISLSGDSIDENFSLRSEEAIPSVDSVVNNTIYIHYEKFPSKDSILNPQSVLLGEKLLNMESRFKLDITNKRL